MCNQKFVMSQENRLVKELLNKIKFKCQDCDQEFLYELREKDIHNLSIETCPFGCQDFIPCYPDQLE